MAIGQSVSRPSRAIYNGYVTRAFGETSVDASLAIGPFILSKPALTGAIVASLNLLVVNLVVRIFAHPFFFFFSFFLSLSSNFIDSAGN